VLFRRMVSLYRHNPRNSDKYLKDAQDSGILNIPNRKFRDVLYMCNDKYSLLDVTDVDLSSNSLQEVPLELNEWYSLNRLVLAKNSIKTMPNFFANFCLLHTLDLSNNLLNNLPSFLSALTSVVVLRFQNNKITHLAPQIGKLGKCEELDVSGNQIEHIPDEIGTMKSLYKLDLSRNNIEVLPEVISNLPLVHFDVSSNRIEMIPLIYKNISSLKHFNVIENPLRLPSLHVLKYGRVHFFKALEADLAKLQQQASASAPLVMPRPITKEDSFDTVIERFSSVSSARDETLKFVETESIVSNEHSDTKIIKDIDSSASTALSRKSSMVRNFNSSSSKVFTAPVEEEKKTEPKRELTPTPKVEKISKTEKKLKPTTLSKIKPVKQVIPTKSTVSEKQKVFEKQKTSEKLLKKSPAKQLSKSTVGTAQAASKLRPSSSSSSTRSTSVRKGEKRGIPVKTERRKSMSSPKKVSKTMVLTKDAPNMSPAKKSSPKLKAKVQPAVTKLPQSKIASPSHKSYPGYAPPQSGSKTNEQPAAQILNVIKPRRAHTISRSKPKTSTVDEGNFTMRRKTDKMYEELELIESARGKIEHALKIRMDNDLQSALSDGVVLCQLANYVKARSITTIHVPSPAVPKLTMAKARRNVENFLEVCPRLGVKPKQLCSSSDIMHEKCISKVVDTVNSLLSNASPTRAKTSAQTASIKVVSSFLHSQRPIKKS